MLTCKCHDKVAGKTRRVLGAASFSPARSLPMRPRPAPTTCQRGNPARSPERAPTARLPAFSRQGLGDSTCRPGSRVLTAGTRMWSRDPGGGEATAREGPPGQSGSSAASLPRRAPSGPAPTVPASAAHPPLVRSGKAASPARQRPTRRSGFPGAGTRERSASRPPRRGGAGNAVAASRQHLPSSSAPFPQPYRQNTTP